MKRPHPATPLVPGSLRGHRRGKRPAERGLEGRVPSTEELTRRASAQELLAQCLSSRLLLEKEESKRCGPTFAPFVPAPSGLPPLGPMSSPVTSLFLLPLHQWLSLPRSDLVTVTAACTWPTDRVPQSPAAVQTFAPSLPAPRSPDPLLPYCTPPRPPRWFFLFLPLSSVTSTHSPVTSPSFMDFKITSVFSQLQIYISDLNILLLP